MGKYIYEYKDFEFTLKIDDYWHTIYNGKPRAKLYKSYTLLLDYLDSVVSKDRYVLDIGLNNGIFAVPTALMGYKVIGFEPVKDTFENAVTNMAVNYCKDCHLYSYALSNENAELDLYVPICSDNASLSAEAAVANMKSKEYKVEKVQSIRFDDWIKEHPEFSDIGYVKIDIQGGEYNAIEGMREFLTNSHDIYVACEYEEHLNKMGYTYEQLDNLFKELGFVYQGAPTGGDRLWYKK